MLFEVTERTTGTGSARYLSHLADSVLYFARSPRNTHLCVHRTSGTGTLCEPVPFDRETAQILLEYEDTASEMKQWQGKNCFISE